MNRPYDEISAKLRFDGDRARRMRTLVDALWDGLAAHGVSWVGFYLYEGADELVLGPMRNKPACSPIGLHGACGRAFREKRPLIVRDVAELGESYVACDPRDKSELVIPLLDADGTCWGVLDFDSHEVGAFGPGDLRAVTKLLKRAELTACEQRKSAKFKMQNSKRGVRAAFTFIRSAATFVKARGSSTKSLMTSIAEEPRKTKKP